MNSHPPLLFKRGALQTWAGFRGKPGGLTDVTQLGRKLWLNHPIGGGNRGTFCRFPGLRTNSDGASPFDECLTLFVPHTLPGSFQHSIKFLQIEACLNKSSDRPSVWGFGLGIVSFRFGS